MSNRGQSLIEFLLIVPIFLVLVGCIVDFCEYSLSSSWLDYQAYQALLCLDSESSSFCNKIYAPKIKNALIRVKLTNFQLMKIQNVGRVFVTAEFVPTIYHFNNKKFYLKKNKNIFLPVASRL